MPERDPPQVPEARTVVRKKTRLSLVWIVPIVAAAVGVWVAISRIMSEGPSITVELQSAEGLEAGKTKIRYHGVDVGTVMTIELSENRQRVIATAQMAPKTSDLLVRDTNFWVVRPRISGATVSGLGTLISGAYVGMEIGHSKEKRRAFVALTAPPVVSRETPGRFFTLRTPDLGSVDYATPIYFRRLQVGEIASYALDADGKTMNIRAFVQEPYDRQVTEDTRFWHASGIDVSLSASGLSIQTQSLMSILIGGVAFETPPDDQPHPAAGGDSVFTLFGNRAEAFKPTARDPHSYRLVFTQSVRGLALGAPVEFHGITIGEVTGIHPRFDAKTDEFSVPVTIQVDPRMFGVAVVGEDPTNTDARRKRIIEELAEHGLRAQLRSGSLLTGALYVALDFFPDARPATIDWSHEPAQFPTVPGELEGLEASITRIVKKLEKLPIDAIGADVRRVMAELDRTLVTARGTLGSADALVQPTSPLSEQLGTTLQEVTRAARGLRLLADYLEQHPESLLRGKASED
jgi:paraquat-inducible protein B